MNEVWFETNNINNYHKTIIAISNTGCVKQKNGEIRPARYREMVTINGKQIRIYRVIAEHFIPKTQEDIELGRDEVDHKTHEPLGMNINDVRNLRWCTHKENMGFDEARNNNRKAQLGTKHEPRSEFGRKFLEHYGLHSNDDSKLYDREKSYYRKHNKCSWE
jgi:hypothetical protein